jgi:hypothetical protein
MEHIFVNAHLVMRAHIVNGMLPSVVIRFPANMEERVKILRVTGSFAIVVLDIMVQIAKLNVRQGTQE